MTMALLRYLDDTGQLQTRKLDAEHFLIGRAESCHLTFDSDMISREHVRIDLEKDGRFRIHDLGSRNRTYVNGEVITETMVTGGDVLRVGDRVVEFVDDSVVPGGAGMDFLTPDKTEPPRCEWIKIKAPLSLTVLQLEQLALLSGDPPLTARAEDIAGAALGKLILDLQADRGFIALRGEKKTDFRPIAQRALAQLSGGSRTPVSQSFALAAQLQKVAGRYPQTATQLNYKLGYAATAVVAPLTCRGDVIGILYLDRPAGKKPFTSTALQYAAAAGALLGALLDESVRKLMRLAPREGLAWMTTIRRVQSALTQEVTSSDTFNVAMKRFPGRARCGDFAEVVHLDEQRCCVTVVDGGGHGITGIAQASSIQAAVRTAVTVSEDVLMDPANLFQVVNQIVAGSSARQVLPFLYVGLDMASGKLTYLNAGGAPPLLMVAPGRLITLEQSALVLGVDSDFVYEPTRIDLPQDFRLICCTSGLLEATNTGGEALGEQRVHEALLDRYAFESSTAVLSAITRVWNAHLGGTQPDDDALVLVVGYGQQAPPETP